MRQRTQTFLISVVMCILPYALSPGEIELWLLCCLPFPRFRPTPALTHIIVCVDRYSNTLLPSFPFSLVFGRVFGLKVALTNLTVLLGTIVGVAIVLRLFNRMLNRRRNKKLQKSIFTLPVYVFNASTRKRVMAAREARPQLQGE